MKSQELKEWIIQKRKSEFTYCGWCYATDKVYEYGMCKTCWKKMKKRKRL